VKKYCKLVLLVLLMVLFNSNSILAAESIYTVKSGDSLWKIANNNGVTVKQLMEWNKLTSDRLNIGDKLRLQAGNSSDTAKSTVAPATDASGIYTVQAGDCLSLIAQRHGTTVDSLMQLNQLKSSFLQVGQKLKINSNAGSAGASAPVAAPAVANQETNTNQAYYIVQAGDCIGAIAQKYSMNSSELMSINGLKSDLIYPGQKLLVAANTSNQVSRGSASPDGQQVADFASQYLGVPYAYGGSSPAGFDCSGFVQYVYKHFGYQLARTAASQYQQGSPVSKSELMAGDLVFFACNGGGIDHSGIYVGNNRFIHSSSPRSGGVIYTSMSENYYARSYVGARRILR
jgi:LysM repeat protein